MTSFTAENLKNVLSELEQKASEGVFEIVVKTNSNSQLSQIIAFKQGRIIYGGSQFTTPEELARRVAKKLDISIINAALKTSSSKIQDKTSFAELFSFLNKYRLLKPNQLEEVLTEDVIQTLEKVLPYAGSVTLRPELKFDLTCKALPWSELSLKLAERKLEWSKLHPIINSSLDIPRVSREGLTKISSITVTQHCQKWIDGKKSIAEIAEAVNQEPINLAQDYYRWVKQGWITFGQKSQAVPKSSPSVASTKPKAQPSNPDLVTILSVDDSPVVQTMIKRAIGDRYNLLLASNGVDALKIINANKDKIKLALLDVTMPDIDGLDLCRTIRKMEPFVDLPIIMLTAKDGMFDKFKGKFAGSTEYLTKPVDREQLLTTIEKYIFSATSTKS